MTRDRSRSCENPSCSVASGNAARGIDAPARENARREKRASVESPTKTAGRKAAAIEDRRMGET